MAALRRAHLALRAEPAADDAGRPGTTATEQWDARHVPARILLRLLGYVRRHPANIEQTLAKLDSYMSSEAASGTGSAPDQLR